jgi:hypothetical protein
MSKKSVAVLLFCLTIAVPGFSTNRTTTTSRGDHDSPITRIVRVIKAVAHFVVSPLDDITVPKP